MELRTAELRYLFSMRYTTKPSAFREEMGTAARGAPIPKVGYNTEVQAGVVSPSKFTPE